MASSPTWSCRGTPAALELTKNLLPRFLRFLSAGFLSDTLQCGDGTEYSFGRQWTPESLGVVSCCVGSPPCLLDVSLAGGFWVRGDLHNHAKRTRTVERQLKKREVKKKEVCTASETFLLEAKTANLSSTPPPPHPAPIMPSQPDCRDSSAMDPPLQSEDSQTQTSAPSPLTTYRWHTGGRGEKAAGGFRWGRFTGWGRTLSHQESMVSSQPAPRSLFRRVLSAPPKESRPNRLRFSKTLWGRHKNVDPKPNPKAPVVPELELAADPDLPVAQIPEPPTPDMPVWNIDGFTLLEGRMVMLGEEEGPRPIRMGSASSESSMQAALGNLKDPVRTPGKIEPEATGSNQVHNVRRVSLCSLGCPRTYYVDYADLELTKIQLPLLPEC
ncbi:RAS protein activator-like-3 [Apodemus speciosus]|uniref:RAS protein activator-like-3 n=1 Tax=Apodemus speciosus TaxID=105296 RepID=A0ABQ0FNP9_APOSI